MLVGVSVSLEFPELLVVPLCLQINPHNVTISTSIITTIWLFNIARENPLQMDVSSSENHLFLWAMASSSLC